MSSYFYFSKTKSVPMNLSYDIERDKDTAKKNGVYIEIEDYNRFVMPGNHIEIRAHAKNRTPDDLIYDLGPNGETKCNYELYIIASIKYRDQTGRERGNYFCKRYDFEKQNFFNAPEYENED